MEDVVKFSDGEIITLDGKTHRRSHDRKRGVKALHVISVWVCRNDTFKDRLLMGW